MSQSSTPHNGGPAGQSHRSDHNTPKESKNANSTVTDSTAANSRQLLNAYVYDFLIKSSLPNTAKAFYQEADIPISATTNSQTQQNVSTNALDLDLPPLSISMDAPQGFLYEWWQIFWDVFNARTHRVGSAAAQQYFQLHLLRQRQEQALHGMTAQAAQAAQAQALAQQQLFQMSAQQQQQQHQLVQQQVGVPAGSPNNISPQLMGKRPANMNSVARLQQEHAQRQMNNLRQQQLVQLQLLGTTPLNGQQPLSIQSPSKRIRIGESQNPDNQSNGNTPTHVHNLPPNSGQSPHNLQNQVPPQGMMIPNQFNPQFAAAMFAQQQKQMSPQQQMAGAAAAFQQPQLLVPNKQQQMMFNQQQQQQRIPGEFFNNGFTAANMPMQNRPPQQQQLQGPNGPIKTPQMPPQQFRQQPQSQPQQPQQQSHQSPPANGSSQHSLLQNGNANVNSDNSLQARNSLLGLQDYQMQLILIERNNKKKMEDVRNIDIKNESATNQQLVNSDFNTMFNNQLQQHLQQQLQPQGKWNGAGNDNSAISMPPPQLSRGTPVSSPAITNQTGSNKNQTTSSAPTSTTTKKKAVPKTRKKKGAAANTSEPATPTTPATPAASAPTPHSATTTTTTNGNKRGAKRKESIRDSVSSDVAPIAIKKEDQTSSATTTSAASQNTTTTNNIDVSPHTAATLNNTSNNSNEVDANMLNDYQQFNADAFGAAGDSNFLSDFNTGSRGDDMALDLNVFLDTDNEVNNGSFMFNWGNVTES